jgi:hypothetical protein
MRYIISYPRSGQHLVQRYLEFACNKLEIPYSYCEYYNCCKTIPCKHGKIVQKNHDFQNNKVPIIQKNKYIVLYRSDLISQMEAEYRYNNCPKIVAKDLSTISSLEKEIHYDQETKLKIFDYIKNHRNKYLNFIDKWILNTHSNLLKINYESIIHDPSILDKTIEFFFDKKCSLSEEFQKIENIEPKHITYFL